MDCFVWSYGPIMSLSLHTEVEIFLRRHSKWTMDLICRPRNLKCFQSVQILSFLVILDVMPILNVALEIILPLSGKRYLDIYQSWPGILSEPFSSMLFSLKLLDTYRNLLLFEVYVFKFI